ncbi:MAG TPA: hypothetical protein VEJ18_07855 [Planctomycetota bacterium]|nr:hypothetical protein [Planctomycetota bacterium]
MADIISAKCFGCGHIVKVPSALGGKKARCPKCTNTIAIPALSETQDDIVGDDQLPEVAKEGDPIEGEEILEEDPQEDAPQTASSAARRALGGRRTGVREGGAAARGGARPTAPRLIPPRRSSNAGLVVGLLVGALALGALAFALTRKPADDRNRGPVKGGPSQESRSGSETTRTAADAELEARCRDFLSAWNKAQIAQAAAFYDPEPSAEIKKRVGQMIEMGVQFKNPEIRAVSASQGTVTFLCEYQSSTEAAAAREVTLKWRQDGGTWYVVEGP